MEKKSLKQSKTSYDIIAGDIGGTHTRLGEFAWEKDHVVHIRGNVYKNRETDTFEEILYAFVAEGSGNKPYDAGSFGVAGTVENGRCTLTNLPWVIDKSYLMAVRFL